MPEHRARKHHQDRVAETLREEIGSMIEGELSDPRINFCYVTEVILNPGAKSAMIYVAVDSAVPDIVKAETDTIAGLEAAKGYIRFELKERMGVRHIPDLSFHPDRSGRFQAPRRTSRSRTGRSCSRRSPRARRPSSSPTAADILATRDAVAALGAAVEDRDGAFVVRGGTLRSPAGRSTRATPARPRGCSWACARGRD